MLREWIRRRGDSLSVLALILATLGWVAYAGKDLSWDVFNHHLYLPFAWLNDRHLTDFYAAGPQSYQNPLGYFPSYWLIVNLGLPAWGVGAALGVLHSLCAVVAYRIASTLWAADAHRVTWSLLAALFAWMTPPYLVLSGTTSVDPTATLLVLAALKLVMGGIDQPGRHVAAALAGALLGMAFAIKQSNAVFVLAVGTVLLWRCVFGSEGWKQVAALIGGFLLSAVACMAWWCADLWQQFRNPIFPLFNNVFHSPYAAEQPMLATRFMPDGVLGYLERPVELMRPKEYIWTEASMPDLRPFLLEVGAVVAVAYFAIRLLVGRKPEAAGRSIRLRLASVDVQLAVFIVVSYVLWLKTSGNARYGLPLVMLIGLQLVRLVAVTLPLKPARIAVMLVAVLQFGYFLDAGRERYAAHRWDSRPYLDITMPQKLAGTPFLHVPLGLQTHASLAAYMHPGGAMMNPIGQVSLPTDGVVGERVVKLLDAWRGRTRVLMQYVDQTDVARLASMQRLMTAMLYRLDLDIDWADCLVIQVGRPEAAATAATASGPVSVRADGVRRLSSCAAVPRRAVDESHDRERAVADRVFATLETSCPAIFGPPGRVSERGVGQWQRFYPNTDAIVTVSPMDGVLVTHGRSNINRIVGSIDEVLAGKSRFPCKMWSLLAPD